MKHFKRILTATFVAVALAAAVAGCAGPQVQDYAQEQPKLDLKEYFSGPMKAHGVFTDRSGRVVKRFVVDMQTSWVGTEGTLDERFAYSDGTTGQRIWHLTDLGQGRYSGRADDVIGEAVITMRVSGVALLEVLRVSAAAKRDTAKRAVEHLAMIALRV